MTTNERIKKENRKQYGWHRVEDGLPPEIHEQDFEEGDGVSDEVLVRTIDGSIIAAWYNYHRHGWYTMGIGKERCGYEEFLTKYDDIHDNTVVQWRPIPECEQGHWLCMIDYKPKPGTYRRIEVSWLENHGEYREYSIFFFDEAQNAWLACSDGRTHEFDYWRPLQEIN